MRAVGYRPAASVRARAERKRSCSSRWGLVVGTVCALVAIAPAASDSGARIPLNRQSWLLLLAVLAAGLVSSMIATTAALRGALVGALRSE